MSFSAQVKDELSRIESQYDCERAQLAAIVRTCGTLSVSGQRQFKLSLSTETGSVARTLIKLFRSAYDITCELTVRRSVLHKARNYLIVVQPDQPNLSRALVEMGVLTDRMLLEREIPPALVATPKRAAAYLRGAFMAGGFIAEPHADAHFELVAQSMPFAEGLMALFRRLDISAHVSRRRGSFVIYLKSAEDILAFLVSVGAPVCALSLEEARLVKSLRNDTNRLVNAEFANQRKASQAASSQSELIDAVTTEIGLDALPAALRDFCTLRLENPEMSLRELGEAAHPPLSKSAVYHRVRRLESLLAERRAQGGADAVESEGK